VDREDVPDLSTLVHAVRRRAGAGEPLDELRVAVSTSTDLVARADELTGYFIDAARNGVSFPLNHGHLTCGVSDLRLTWSGGPRT
jgi:hypothetical protein